MSIYEVLYKRLPDIEWAHAEQVGKSEDLAEAQRMAREAVAYGIRGRSMARVFDENGTLVYEVTRGEDDGWKETPLAPR